MITATRKYRVDYAWHPYGTEPVHLGSEIIEENPYIIGLDNGDALYALDKYADTPWQPIDRLDISIVEIDPADTDHVIDPNVAQQSWQVGILRSGQEDR